MVIVVNERDPDSLRVGRHYSERRGVPEENILRLDAPTKETISRQEFVETIYNPLLRQLIEKDWIRGMTSPLRDDEGRMRGIVEGHRIAYLVLCRGVPLRVEHDPALVTPEMERTGRKEFLTSQASVDSELALLTVKAPSIAFMANPLFQNGEPSQLDLFRVIKVARLDGPTAAHAMALVDGALEAERKGLRGRAYLDVAGPHPNGVEWLRSTGEQIRALGYDLTVRDAQGVFPIAARFDAPVLYFGWYAPDMVGPFELEDFRFPPGAVAFHIHSFSARTLRSDTAGWSGPLVARGAAVTVGNVFEPYLELSHRPDLFLEHLRQGGNVGDAGAYSIRGYGWQAVLIGDPLYRPFALSLEEQLDAAMRSEEETLSSYSILRRMNQLVSEDERKEALTLGTQGLDRHPSLALALRVAELQVEARERRQALQTLRMFSHLQRVPLREVMVAKEAADLLSSLNEHARALEVYEILLREGRLRVELKLPLLEDGIRLADRLGGNGRTRAWRRELEAMRAAGGAAD